jgi:hypothetical protein
VLNILKAKRDAFPRVQPDSQPIARWQSSQAELLWDIMAGRSELVPVDEFEALRRAVPSPSMSQEHIDNLTAAVPLLNPEVITQSIAAMEAAEAASQGSSPALLHVLAELWEAIRVVVRSPASRLPEALSRSVSFSRAREPTPSGGSSPMDISPPSQGHLDAPISPPLLPGDAPEAPIILSSDESVVEQVVASPSSHKNTGERHDADTQAVHAHTALSDNSSLMPRASGESSLSDYSSGQDAVHPILLSSGHSSFHSSDHISVPDMGSARQGGKMSTGKATDQYEDASPAVLAWARYLNVIPARDTRSITPDCEPSEVWRTLPILQLFATTPLTDGSVFTHEAIRVAHEEAAGAMTGITDELNRVHEGFSHYFLSEPLTLLEDPSVPITSEHLRHMADVVAAVLSGGPKTMKEADNNVWAALPPGDWYHLATFIMVAIARGCICTTDIGRKGAFNVEPCRDMFLHDESLTQPQTQRDLLTAVSAQVQEELKDEGVLLLQDSIDGLRTTIWRAHEGQIRAWTEREVLSVYKRLSDICLSDILDLIEREASVEEITEAMKEDINMEIRGKFKGKIAEEKSKAYATALDEARTAGLRDAQAQGAVEAAQKGKSYQDMLISRAEDEAKIKADVLFKSWLESARTKMKHKVESVVEAEQEEAISEQRLALKSRLTDMDYNSRKDHVRSLAIQLGLLNELAMPIPSLPKRAKVGNESRTAPLAASKALGRVASPEVARCAPSSRATPTPAPSSCPAAEKDDITPRNSPSRMEWDSSLPEDPLPSIDFDADTHSSAASVYAPGNTMEDDAEVPTAVASFRDPDSGALNLSTQSSPPDEIQATPQPAPPLKSEVAQLFDLIVAKMMPMEIELSHIAGIVDGTTKTTSKPATRPPVTA